jgi:hypothetical protein
VTGQDSSTAYPQPASASQPMRLPPATTTRRRGLTQVQLLSLASKSASYVACRSSHAFQGKRSSPTQRYALQSHPASPIRDAALRGILYSRGSRVHKRASPQNAPSMLAFLDLPECPFRLSGVFIPQHLSGRCARRSNTLRDAGAATFLTSPLQASGRRRRRCGHYSGRS